MEPERERQQLRDLMRQGAAAFDIPDITAGLALYRTAFSLAIDAQDQAAADECRQYLQALLLLDAIGEKTPGKEPTPLRVAEMAAWCTHCQLRPTHQALVLRVAINTAAKVKNYASVLCFTERLLALCPQSQDVMQLCGKASRVSRERGGTNAVSMQYEPGRKVSLCPASLTPLYRDETATVAWCEYCNHEYQPRFAGQRCCLCQRGELLYQPMLTGSGLADKSRLLCTGREPSSQPVQQSDEWTEAELEIYADLARSLGLKEH